MAVIALTSTKGSPGVTTTALALALIWPRPCLLLEADVAGSSSILAGYFNGTRGHGKGLVDLAVAHRRGALADGLHQASIPLEGSKARFVPGLTSPAQSGTMQPLWEPIAAVLRGLESTGTDVIVDAGRLGSIGGPLPLIREADVALLVTRSTLPDVAAARARATGLRDELASRGTGDDALWLLLIGEGRPFSGREAHAAIGLPMAASMAWDPRDAAVLSVGQELPRRGLGTPERRWQTSSLVRSSRSCAAALDGIIHRRRERLAPGALIDAKVRHV